MSFKQWSATQTAAANEAKAKSGSGDNLHDAPADGQSAAPAKPKPGSADVGPPTQP
jgi:hypothetical protein